MKSVLFQLWMWVMVLTTTTGYSQQPVISADSIPAYPKDSAFLPDCDKHTKSFRYFTGGQWQYRANAANAYAYVLDYTGEAPGVSPEDALKSVEEAMTNPLITSMKGFVGGIWQGPDGNWCMSLTDTLKTFDGRFWFRINARWSVYLRDGCANISLVYDPAPPTPQFTVKAPPCDTVHIRDTVRIENPAPPQPCQNCCPGDSVKYTFELFGVLDFERIGGKLHKGFGFGLEWGQWYLHRNDKKDPWFEKPVSFYGGLTAYIGKKGIEFTPTCDTCGYWGDVPGGVVFRSDVYAGFQHRLFQKNGVFGFGEMRYDLVNTEHQEKFLSDEGIKARGGLRIKLETPRKMPIFRSVQVELGPQVSTYTTPTNNLAISAGGFLELRVNLGKRNKEVRHEQDSIHRAQTYKQFQQDSVKREEELDQFLVESPQPIVLDSTDMAFETPIPNAKGGVDKSQQKLISRNLAKAKVHQLIYEQNELKKQVQKGDVTKRPELAQNVRELKKAKKDLKRLQRPTFFKRVGFGQPFKRNKS